MLLFIIPLHDRNPRECRPYATWTLMGLLTVLGVLHAWAPASFTAWAGLLPGTAGLRALMVSPWIPAGLADLVVALLFLWIFADNLEDRFGWPGFIAAYVAWTAIGGLAHLLLAPSSGTPYLGPAYAVSGVLGAYVALFPTHEVRSINLLRLGLAGHRRGQIFSELIFGPTAAEDIEIDEYLPAWTAIAGWAMLQLALFFAGGNAAWPWVHLVLLAAGAATALGLKSLLGFTVAAPETDPAAPVLPRRHGGPGQVGAPAPPPQRYTVQPVAGPAPVRPAAPVAPGAPPPLETAPAETALSLEPEAPPAPAPGPDEPCSVIRLTDEIRDVGLLGRTVAQHTGELFADVTRRLRVTRGFVVRELPRARAEALARALTQAGIAAAAVPLSLARELPAPAPVAGAGCDAGGFVFETRSAGAVQVRWSEVSFVAAAQFRHNARLAAPGAGIDAGSLGLGGSEWAGSEYAGAATPAPAEYVERTTPVVDVVSYKRGERWRVVSGECHFRPMAVAGGPAPNLRGFAREVAARRGAVPVNAGVKVLAQSGLWGYLDFRSERDFDDYCRWLSLVILHRQAAGRRAQYLE